MSVQLTIDDRTVEVREGASVLEAINQLAISIPQLCKDPDRPALGACRTCLVQIDGMRGFPASCSTPVREGMVVHTDAPDVERIRRGVIELTVAMLPGFGQGTNGQDSGVSNGQALVASTQTQDVRAQPGATNHRSYGELKTVAEQHGVTASRFGALHTFEPDVSNPFFIIDREACILCGRCTDACDNLQHIGAISMINSGHNMKVGTFGDLTIRESICTSCGSCVAACPTQAFRPKQPAVPAVKKVDTTCPYCGVGCGITVHVAEGEKMLMMADDKPKNQSSLGMLCVKGRFGTGFIQSPNRVTTPLIRRNGQLEPATWDEALDLVATKLAEHQGHVGALSSAKGTNEDGYLIQKFVRAMLGTNNIDHCTRLCHSPSVEAMLEQLGSGATSNSYVDFEEAGCLVVIGSDTAANHPVIASRIRRAIDERGVKLIVVNPKRVELCYYADLWLRQKPGTDVALFNGLARIIMDEGLWNRSFVESRTEGFDAWVKSLDEYTPERTSEITGVPVEDLYQAARWYATPPKRSGSCLIWGMGVTQHSNGTDNARSILNLALVTGQLGKPGNGISPLRGQNNVQGCGDAGCIPDSLPGYQSVTGPQRLKFEEAWGCSIQPTVGLRVTEMIEAADRGDLRAMYIVGENPMLSEPNLHHAYEAMRKLDFICVQDIFLQETAELAHVVLPAAGFAEKNGTFTNSERRVQRVHQIIQPRGQARPDWEIVCDLAKRTAIKLGKKPTGFDFASPADVFAEMAALVPFLSGIRYERLEKGGIQWPCPTPDHPGTRYMYAESFPRGLGKFVPVYQGKQAEELPDDEYPLILNTGRTLYHWHGGTITREVSGLMELQGHLPVSIHPNMAKKLGIEEGDQVLVQSRRGELTGRASITKAVRRGEVFVPFTRLSESAANFLTNAAFDPHARIPEYKVCAVKVVKLAAVPA